MSYIFLGRSFWSVAPGSPRGQKPEEEKPEGSSLLTFHFPVARPSHSPKGEKKEEGSSLLTSHFVVSDAPDPGPFRAGPDPGS
jgi:hypothetical protein